ncbi:MAG: N-formylglutamate amidohydrolase [Polyangiaceae bacterium]
MTSSVKSPLLGVDDPAAFEVVRPHGRSPAFLLCDHASHRIPKQLVDLGLSEQERLDHIGWDIGAADCARALSELLDATLVLSGYSRLVIDCNRPPRVASSIPTVTGGVSVPGNADLTDQQKAERAEACFWPYHRAVSALLDERRDTGRPTFVLSMHSFTPFLGAARPWHIAMLYGKDRRLAGAFLERLRKEERWVVGDNEPYRVTPETDYSIPNHAEDRGHPGVLIEIRQDLLSTADGPSNWAYSIASCFGDIVKNW